MGEQVNRIGKRLGNYHLLRLLGEGGYAQVYLGEHIYLGTLAAIKVLRTRMTTSDVEELRAEARTIARLAHPHIVRVLEFEIEENTSFLVMDYAVGGTLRQQHPKGTTLPQKTIVSYVQQIADALQYAHEQKVIHRDVKPENMLLDHHHQVLLSDFGIAAATQSTREQMAQGIAGTVTYMSPEQLKGRFGPASDQYSLGVVVYEWLCGQRPFRGSFAELCTQHLLAPPPPLREKMPSISPELELVVMKALAKDPAQRFVNISAFATALREACLTQSQSMSQFLQGSVADNEAQENTAIRRIEIDISSPGVDDTSLVEPETVIPSTGQEKEISSMRKGNERPMQPLKRLLARRAVIMAGLGGLASLGIGFTWFTTTRNGSVPSSAVLASPGSKFQSPSPSAPSMGSTLYSYEGHNDTVDVIAWSPDGKWIASGGGDKTVQIWDAAKGSHILTYREHTEGVYALTWSPDGKRIASGSFDKKVRVWDVITGGHTFTYVFTHNNLVEEVAWSPNGKRIAVTGVRTMEAWNAADGSQRIVYQKGLGAAKTVAWSPRDGHQLASGGGTLVYIWDAADGTQAFVYKGHTDRVDTVAWSPDGRRIASGGKDKTVHVWDAVDGGHTVIYRGHTDYINSLAWSPDGKWIVSGGNDETAQVWDATNGSLIFTYRGHTSDINAVAWSPDGKRIASGDDGKSVRVWMAPEAS